jgi:hypothetical protein
MRTFVEWVEGLRHTILASVEASVEFVDHDGRVVPFGIDGFDRYVFLEWQTCWDIVWIAFLTTKNDSVKGFLEL